MLDKKYLGINETVFFFSRKSFKVSKLVITVSGGQVITKMNFYQEVTN